MLDSNPRLRAGNRSTPLQEASGLHLPNIDFGRGRKANISTPTWHKRLGHLHAADQEKLWRKDMGVAYKGNVLHYSIGYSNVSIRQQHNKETETRGTKSLHRSFIDIRDCKGVAYKEQPERGRGGQ